MIYAQKMLYSIEKAKRNAANFRKGKVIKPSTLAKFRRHFCFEYLNFGEVFVVEKIPLRSRTALRDEIWKF